MIRTNRIDLTLKFQNPIEIEEKNKIIHKKDAKMTTYLHLATRNADLRIISLFLDGHLIDINITDDLDETPLMEACRYENKKMINILSLFDGVDYLHKNKNGDDALHIINPHFKGKIEDKDEYFNELMRDNLINIIDDDNDDNNFSYDSSFVDDYDFDY